MCARAQSQEHANGARSDIDDTASLIEVDEPAMVGANGATGAAIHPE